MTHVKEAFVMAIVVIPILCMLIAASIGYFTAKSQWGTLIVAPSVRAQPIHSVRCEFTPPQGWYENFSPKTLWVEMRLSRCWEPT